MEELGRGVDALEGAVGTLHTRAEAFTRASGSAHAALRGMPEGAAPHETQPTPLGDEATASGVPLAQDAAGNELVALAAEHAAAIDALRAELDAKTAEAASLQAQLDEMGETLSKCVVWMRCSVDVDGMGKTLSKCVVWMKCSVDVDGMGETLSKCVGSRGASVYSA